MTRSISDLHLFVVWSRGREKEDEILSDLAHDFELLDVAEITWTARDFSRNLTRFYGEALPSGSEKERHCGNGPFLVIVVRDSRPENRLRSLAHGKAQVIDVRTLDAKERYRVWTGGGHRVHATLDAREFAHDLFLLLGRLPTDYEDAQHWNGEIVSYRRDLSGAGGWRDVGELLTALELTAGRVALTEPIGSDGRLSLAVEDPWWAAVVADGEPGVQDPWAREHVVHISGRDVRLQLESTASSKQDGTRQVVGAWAQRLRAGAIDLTSRLSSRKAGLALVYHGLALSPGDPSQEIMAPHGLQEFAAQLRLLKRRYRIVRASELPEAVRSRRRGARLPIALTFDDDLASHARLAAPTLRELDLPATFFLAGATLGDSKPSSWWVDLQQAIDRQTLSASDLPELDQEEITGALERRAGAARGVAAAIERLPAARRRDVAARLRRVAGDGFRAQLEPGDIRALAAQGLEIGFHTREHPLLTGLDDDELAAALTDGRDRLEREIGQPVRLLAYPHGKTDSRVTAAAADAGYVVAYAGGGRPVLDGFDPLNIPRWEPPRTAGADFELTVARTLRG